MSIYISKYCHSYIWVLHFLLSRVTTENRSVCHGNLIVLRLCLILRTSMSRSRHESVGASRINGREGAVRSESRGSMRLSLARRCVSLATIFAASVSRWVPICDYWSSLERYRRCNIFAGKCAERCDVWRACDTFGSKRSSTGRFNWKVRCWNRYWNSCEYLKLFLLNINFKRRLPNCKLDYLLNEGNKNKKY